MTTYDLTDFIKRQFEKAVRLTIAVDAKNFDMRGRKENLHCGSGMMTMSLYAFLIVFFWHVADLNVAYAQVRFERAALTVESGDARHKFIVEVAQTPGQRRQGLMGRERLPLNTGMLFIFEQTEMIHMWMANTPSSLDMLFADTEGRIVHIERGTEPFSTRIISSKLPARLVLEVRAGTADRLGITSGDRLVMDP